MADPAYRVTVHILKTWPMYFGPLFDQTKKFEIRYNDRNFKVGDQLLLREWDPDKQAFTGREVRRVVTYLTGFNQAPNWVVLSLSHTTENL